MKKIILFCVLTMITVAAAAANVWSAPALTKGGPLPDFTLSAPKNSAERSYLGVGSGPFRVANIKAELVVVEIFSMYCPYCQKEAPNVNAVYNKIENDPALKGRIKFLGIGAGNSQTEVDIFRERYKIPFALVPDKDFQAHELLGQPRTPFFVILKLKPGSRERVVATHLGAYESPEKFLDDLRAALKEAK